MKKKNDKYVTKLNKKTDKNNDGIIDYKYFLEFIGLKK